MYNLISSKLLQAAIFLFYLSMLIIAVYCSLLLDEVPYIVLNLINISAAFGCVIANCIAHKKFQNCYKNITHNQITSLELTHR